MGIRNALRRMTSDSPDRSPPIIPIIITHYAAAVVAVALRFYTRVAILRKVGLDDVFVAAAVFLGAAQTATILLQIEHGGGRHAVDIELRHFNHMLMYAWINVLVYYLANWAVKMSILALYYRIGSSKSGLPWVLHSKTIGSVAAAITVFTMAVLLVEIFACTPISQVWDVLHMDTGCMHKYAFNIVQASINVSVDLVLLLYPLPLLLVIKTNTKQRTALAAIFSVGLVPLIASGMRLCEIVMAGTSKGATWLEGDVSWNWAWVPAWSQIEVDVGIIAASLPSLSPLLKRMWSGFAADRSKTSSPPNPFKLDIESTRSDDLSTWNDDFDVMKRERRASLGDDTVFKEVGRGAVLDLAGVENLQIGPKPQKI